MKTLNRICAVLSLVGPGVMGTALSAATLAPGAVVFPTGTTSAASPELVGTVVNDDLEAFTMSGVHPMFPIGGNVQDRVVRSDSTGDLIFAPRIRDTYNIFGVTFEIQSFQITGFGGFDLDVNYRTDGLGDKPISSVSRSGDGNTITVRMDDPIILDWLNPPIGLGLEDSLFLSLATDAQHFNQTGTMVITGRDRGDPGTVRTATLSGISVPTLAPVPVPAGLPLLLAGFGVFGLMRWRSDF